MLLIVEHIGDVSLENHKMFYDCNLLYFIIFTVWSVYRIYENTRWWGRVTALKMDAVGSYETLVPIRKIRRCHIPEGHNTRMHISIMHT